MDQDNQSPERPSSAEPPHTASRPRPLTKATRRIKGEIACAACRHSKIRCDRNVPCSTCVKRGCAALCPNGTIPPGDGGRFVEVATGHLQSELLRLQARMRSLEDGIAILHALESDKPHPLLINAESKEGDTSGRTQEETSTDVPVSPVAGPGTLYVDARGSAMFFGPSGGSESLLIESGQSFKGSHRPPLQELDSSYLPPEINRCYQSFPFTPPNVVAASIEKNIESFLPPLDRAISLCDTFLEHLSWMFHIVSRNELVHELIPIFYREAQVGPSTSSAGPHDLALLFLVLAIGCLVDLELPAYNMEAQHYYRLARATLALHSVLGTQSTVTIKALHLMSIYYGMSGNESNLEQSYIMLDLAGQVAARIGFHVDPSLWGFQGREAYDRRVYFWNLMAGILWQSIVTGRPPSFLLSSIECRIPSPEEEQLYQAGEVPLGFGIWGFKATAECLVPLTRAILGVTPPAYEAVLALDRKIRNLTVPNALSDILPTQSVSSGMVTGFQGSSIADRTALSMREFVRSHYQDLMLLFLHRAHFAQAMTESPVNPLKSPYAHSVTAAYASACGVLRSTRDQAEKNLALCSRVWRIWSFTFSAAVIAGTLAIRGVHLNLKPSPYEEFQMICSVFERAAETSSRAARAMPVLRGMQEKAKRAQEYFQKHRQPLPVNAEGLDELAYFGGRAGVIQAGKGCGEEQQMTPLPYIPSSRRSATASTRSGSLDDQDERGKARSGFGVDGPTTDGIHLDGSSSQSLDPSIGAGAASAPIARWDLQSMGYPVNLQSSFASPASLGGKEGVYGNRDPQIHGLATRGPALHGTPMSSVGQEPMQWSVSAGDETLYDRWSLYLGAEPQSGSSERDGPGASQANFRPHLRQSDLGHGNAHLGQ